MSHHRRVPDHFLFGAATAAFQIEGAAFEDGRRASIWDTFARTPGAVAGGDTGDVACDHYHRYRDDVTLMRDLGLQTYRFSVSWARVRPDGGPVNRAGLDFYRRLVDELRGADIVPWLTLYHWDMPQALQERGGWTARESAERFTEYALDVHDALGDTVQHWTTLNEPWCSAFLGHTAGVHAPGHRSASEGLRAAHHLLLAHGRTIEALRGRDASLALGVTLNLTVADASDPDDAGDVDAARRIDGQFNRLFLDPLFRGAYPEDVLADLAAADPRAADDLARAIAPGDLAAIAQPIDALGVNYYHGEEVASRPDASDEERADAPAAAEASSPFVSHEGIYWRDRGLPRTGMGWEVQPEGLTRVLERTWREYAEPAGTVLYVTESGAAYDDEVVEEGGERRVHDVDRVTYLRAHVAAVQDAIHAGVDVRGYFAWSLLDNFEWAWGYAKRFGIVHVDYATQERTVKDSGREYRRLIEARTADAATVPATVRS